MKQLTLLFLGILVLLLAGCQSNEPEETWVDQLPLDADKPTLILFYSDN